MSVTEFINNSLDRAVNYLALNNYKGWDPYDGLTTNVSIIHRNYISRLLFFYFNKFSPVNLRKHFGIEKKIFTQSHMFLGLALVELGKCSEAEYFLKEIIADSIHYEKEGCHCWDGLDIPIQMRKSYKKRGAPNVISSELAARFILKYLKSTGRNDYKLREVLDSVKRYFCEYMLVSYKGKIHFKYYDVTPDEIFVFNANANICAFLAEYDNYNSSTENKTIVYDVLSSLVNYQEDDGYWNYNINLKTEVQKKQVDFHQGFVLDSLLRVMNSYGKETFIENAYNNGLSFYYKKQFLPSGQGVYRYPKKYPVNIHNQAQGIVTFTKAALAGYGDHFYEYAHTIARWTIKNMQDSDGHFYYMKCPFFTNKIPYIRWSDSMMVYSLSVLLACEKKKRNDVRT